MIFTKKPLIHLMGPTGSGKTDLAIALAQVLPIEIISVDSALVYQGMDIGSAKPSAACRIATPHHLIDMVSPEQHYSVAHFLTDAKQAIADIQSRHKIPLLVGGTMLYFKALLEGLADIPAVPEDIRQAIRKEYSERGCLALFQQLQICDPDTARRLHPQDAQRITRALEVFAATDQPLSYWLQQQPSPENTDHILQFSLLPEDRAALHQRLADRLDAMWAQGFVEEVAALQARYTLHENLPAMRCVGYRQVWQYLAGTIDQAEMRAAALAASRQLAKRQLTWLRRWPNHQIIASHQPDTCAQVKEYIFRRGVVK